MSRSWGAASGCLPLTCLLLLSNFSLLRNHIYLLNTSVLLTLQIVDYKIESKNNINYEDKSFFVIRPFYTGSSSQKKKLKCVLTYFIDKILKWDNN